MPVQVLLVTLVINELLSLRERAALQHKVSYSTTLAGARATCMALEFLDTGTVNSLQALHQEQII